MRREEEAVQKPYVGPFWVAVSSLGYSRMDALSLSNDAATSSALLLPDKPFSTACGTKVCTVCEAIQSRIFTASLPRRSVRDIPMKLSSTIVVAALLLGSLASVAQQPAPALTGDAKPDTGIMNADVYTNQFFGFSYRVPAQWTGKAIQRSQPGQRFYQLLSALPATSGASIQYMGIQAEDITAPVVKTASQFIQSSPLAGKNSAYEMLGPVREMEFGGHHFARADYKTKPSADDAGLTMYQTQLVTVLHNHAVTLSFTTDSQPALDQLAASASSMVFLNAPSAAPIPAAPAPQPAVTTPAVAVATPAPVPAKPRAAPEVTNGTVQVSFSDDPAPVKTTTQAAATPEAQTPAPEPAKSEPVAVQTTAQPVTFNPKPEPKVETVAATAPAKSKPSAGIPV